MRHDISGRWVLREDAESEVARLKAERDKALAQVAAVIEQAAHLIECDGDALGGKSGAAKAIRALTPADAQAALRALKGADQ